MALTRHQLKAKLAAAFPKMMLRNSEEFCPMIKGAIWTSGEDGPDGSDSLPLFDSYATNETIYPTFGVHREMEAILKAAGWAADFQDPGTVLIFN
jgi:hypothetical protein